MLKPVVGEVRAVGPVYTPTMKGCCMAADRETECLVTGDLTLTCQRQRHRGGVVTYQSPAQSGVVLTGGHGNRQALDTVRTQPGDVEETVGTRS